VSGGALQSPAPLKNKKRRKAEVSGGALPVASTAEKQEKKESRGVRRCAPSRQHR